MIVSRLIRWFSVYHQLNKAPKVLIVNFGEAAVFLVTSSSNEPTLLKFREVLHIRTLQLRNHRRKKLNNHCIVMPVCSSLAESAFRVFVSNLFIEAQQLLADYQSRVFTYSFFQVPNRASTLRWDQAVAATKTLLKYIHAYLYSKGSICSHLYGISAIGAAQDALVSALSICRGHGQSDPGIHSLLYNQHALRAKFIVNGLIAAQCQDFELAALWVLAAQKVKKDSELMLLGTNNNTSTSSEVIELAKQYIASASAMDVGNSACSQESILKRLVSRHYRRAAVCSVLGRNHAHKYAAETYQQAVALCQSSVADSTSIAFSLWQSAVASMRLAGDMIAVHTDEASAKNDPLITQTITTAKGTAEDAAGVSTLLAFQEERRKAIEATKTEAAMCRDPLLASVMKLLIEKQEQVQRVKQQFLQAVLECGSKMNNMVTIYEESARACSEVSDLQLVVHKVDALIQDAQYYRRQSLKAHKVTYEEVSLFLCDFWSAVTAKADHMLQQVAELVRDGTVQTMAHDVSGVWQHRYDVVRSFAYVAECVVGTVVEYLDKARGAEAGERVGRDPREAQMWCKAAKCLAKPTQVVASTLKDDIDLSEVATAADGWDTAHAQADQYALIATYLSRSFNLRGVDATEDALKASRLYESLASLWIQRNKFFPGVEPIPGLDVEVEKTVSAFIFQFIALLEGSTKIASNQRNIFEQLCECGMLALSASYTEDPDASHWKEAFRWAVRAKDSADRNSSTVTFEMAFMSLHALTAVWMQEKKPFLHMVCERAVAVMTKATTGSAASKVYWAALAARIVVHATKSNISAEDTFTVAIPDELLALTHAPAVDDAMLCEHAGAHCLELECLYRSSSNKSDADAWLEAVMEISHWVEYFDMQVKQRHSPDPSTDITAVIEYYKVVGSCYVAAAASSPDDDAVSQAWSDAVAMTKEVSIAHIESALAAVQCMVNAARAVQVGDFQLSSAWEEAASPALKVHQLSASSRPFLDRAQCEFKSAECKALAIVAEKGQHNHLQMLLRKAASAAWKTAALHFPRNAWEASYLEPHMVPLARILRSTAKGYEEAAVAAAAAPPALPVNKPRDVGEP